MRSGDFLAHQPAQLRLQHRQSRRELVHFVQADHTDFRVLEGDGVRVVALVAEAVQADDLARQQKARDLHLPAGVLDLGRSEEHTSELQSLMRISYAVFCLKKKNT